MAGSRFRTWGSRAKARPSSADRRLLLFALIVIVGMGAVVTRLFVLQVLSHRVYAALASNQHSIFEELFPERGAVYLRDPKSADGIFPAIINKNAYVVYSDGRLIENPADAARRLAPVLETDEEALFAKLSRKDDPYEPLRRKLDDAKAEQVKALDIKGIALAREQHRYYPEGASLSHVTGFLGANDKGERIGRYGIEGYWNDRLAGKSGHIDAEKDPIGRWIGAAARDIRPAQDGDKLILTIDRSIQYAACEKLRAAVARHGADGGSVVIMDPKTGAVLALCNVPDFDPNDFSNVADLRRFNDSAIFSAYEPGSIFKPFTLVSAIDAGKITPNSTFEDTGSVVIGAYTIRNSDGKAHGVQTMTQVLEESLNTGTIHAVRKLGPKSFLRYMEDFGFGSPTGIELDTESAGDVESLRKKGEIWSATASFGQGITATPIQIVNAFGAIANGGKLMAPHVVSEIVRADGTVEKIEPKAVRQVITKRASSLMGGMLVNVVERGHGKRAAVSGYYVAGKTGTAQVSRGDGQGYEQHAFIGSFVGYAPVDDPAFVMLVKIDRPRDVDWAESSAAPLFGDIAKFLLQYMEIPPDRS